MKKNDKLVEIDFYDKIKGVASGGTIATLMNSLNNPAPKSTLGYDPLQKKIGEDEKINRKFKTFVQRGMSFSKKISKWTGMFVLAD